MSNVLTAHTADSITVSMARLIGMEPCFPWCFTSPMPAVAVQLAEKLHAKHTIIEYR